MGAATITAAWSKRGQTVRRVFDPVLLAGARERLASSVGLSVAGGAVSQACVLISAVLAARILGKIYYGHLASVQAAMAAFAKLASLGLGMVAAKYVSEYRETDPRRAGRILGLASLTALVTAAAVLLIIIIFAASISHMTFGTPILTPSLRWAAFYVLFTILNGYQAGALAALESFSRVARIAVAAGCAGLVCTILLAWRLGEQGAALAFGLTAFFVWAFHQWVLRRELRRYGITVEYRGVWRERFALVRFAIPATYSGVAGSLAVWWCYGYLIRSRGFAEAAVYAAANNLRSAILLVPNLVTRVTTPLLNNLLSNGDAGLYRLVFWFSLGMNTLFAVVVAGFLSVAGRWLLVLFGKDFTASSSLLWIVMGSAVVEVVAGGLFQATFTRPSLGWQIVVISVWSALLVAITRSLVPAVGAEGLAGAYAAAFASSALIYFRLCGSVRSRSSG